MAEETDDLRRFVFAFAGLELLVTKGEKTLRKNLIEQVNANDPTLPVTELFWPGTNDDAVQRNLVFRFAAMAAVISPSTAQDDVKKFKSLAKIRNTMFHGSDDAVDAGSSVACKEVLRRYLGLMASRDATKPERRAFTPSL